MTRVPEGTSLTQMSCLYCTFLLSNLPPLIVNEGKCTKRNIQNGLEMCCRAVILKVLPIEGENTEGKGKLQTIGQRKGKAPGAELWGTNIEKGKKDG